MPQTSVSENITAALEGLLVDTGSVDALSGVNAEASTELRFGVMVAHHTDLDGRQCLELAAISDVLAGIIVRSDTYNQDNELGDTGLKENVQFSRLQEGRIWVHSEEAVDPSLDVFVRAVATGDEVAGQFRVTQDAIDCIDLSSTCKWVNKTAAAGLAQLDFKLP